MFITILAGLIFTLLTVGCVLLVVGTVMKNKWGINVARISCPNCGNSLDRVRAPKTFAQVLWGGSTCDKCGIEVDKWGRPVAQPTSSAR